MSLTPLEQMVVDVVRVNQAEKKDEWRWGVTAGPCSIAFRWRSSKSLWGRFGGGWNWTLGVQIGGRTAIISLLVCSVTLTWKP